ncbi:MAG: ABC transporter permease [Halobacteriaceae archaeon]
MSAPARVRAEAVAAARTFARRRTAVFFTFFFPLLIILIFGAMVRAAPDAGGMFGEPPAYYLPGYLATVVVFTPLSRIGATVTRHREDRRFEKLATTPLSRGEWLLAHALVTAAIVTVASALILVLVVALTGAVLHPSPWLLAYVLAGVGLFVGLGALMGRVAQTQDGVIAASNTVAFPLLFLSETFIPPALLPGWFRPLMGLSPLTYFARGVRAVGTDLAGGGHLPNLALLVALAVVLLVAGALALPVTE